jgi:hypothetical protein
MIKCVYNNIGDSKIGGFKIQKRGSARELMSGVNVRAEKKRAWDRLNSGGAGHVPD